MTGLGGVACRGGGISRGKGFVFFFFFFLCCNAPPVTSGFVEFSFENFVASLSSGVMNFSRGWNIPPGTNYDENLIREEGLRGRG